MHSIEDTLVLPQKIADEMGGNPFNRLLLADAIGITPMSSNYRDLLSSSYRYGFTEGTEKASEISLTNLGKDATQTVAAQKRLDALVKAARTPSFFRQFYEDYANKKVPSPEMIDKILTSSYKVPDEYASEASQLLVANGRFVRIIRDIGGSAHVLVDAPPIDETDESAVEEEAVVDVETEAQVEEEGTTTPLSSDDQRTPTTKPIFIGHGKNRVPLEKLQAILTSFQIPHKVTTQEANLGRPIPQKVKETMEACGSAILIFTKDEQFFDADGSEIWRASENVVHELGASSFAYGDRIVIFKEKGIHFPTNFQSIGYIEFEAENLEARSMDLLKELVGFGLVKITPT